MARTDVTSQGVESRGLLIGAKWVPGLDGAMPVRTAALHIFEQRWASLMEYATRLEEPALDADVVHQVRVWTRRLDAVLTGLPGVFPRGKRKTLEQVVRDVRKRCGKLRDLHVFREFLEGLRVRSTTAEHAGLAALDERARMDEDRHARALRKRASGLLERLSSRGDALLEALRARSERETERGSGKRFGDVAAGVLSEAAERLWGPEGRVLEKDEDLHALRISVKRVRYLSEWMADWLGEEFRADLYPELQRVQELLGRNQDAATAIERLRRRGERWKSGRGFKKLQALVDSPTPLDWNAVRPGLELVREAYRGQAALARGKFADTWSAFCGAGFRAGLERVLAERISELPAKVTKAHPAAAGEGDVERA